VLPRGHLYGLRLGVTYGAAFAAKKLVHRERPCAPLDCGIDNPDFSFYVGHTALAFSTLGGPRLSVALPLAISTGGLRVAGGKHYLTDVLVGGWRRGADVEDPVTASWRSSPAVPSPADCVSRVERARH
jgi:membrane-associated phospholipid phosphatase